MSYQLDVVQNLNATQKDVEDNVLYQRRYQTGLEWNILKDGFFDTRNQVSNLKAQQLLDQQLTHYQQLKRHNNLKMNQCIFWFNRDKIKLLEKRKEMLLQQTPLIEQLYFAKKIKKEVVLMNQTKMAEVNGLNHVYESYNQYISSPVDSSIFLWEAPLFDLNYEVLFSDVKENVELDSLRTLLMASVKDKEKWYTDIRLKSFFRYNYYDLFSTSPSNRSFFTTGLNLSLPLPFSTRQKRDFELQKMNKQVDVLNHNLNQRRIEILNEAYEFRYQLKQYIVFHQKKIMSNEALRQERVKAKLQDVDFNPVHALGLIDEQLQIAIELIDLKQNLYIKLLKIQELAPHIPVEKLLTPVSLPNYFDFEDEVNRNCYVWSKTFENNSNEFLLEYILYNQFDGIQLAVAKEDPYLRKKIEFVQMLTDKKIAVDLMIGRNDLMDSPNYAEELKGMIEAYPMDLIHGIHLDIEPHTRKDWKTDQVRLKEIYLKLLKETKSICNSYKKSLSVDVPLSIDSGFVLSIFDEVDLVRFMAYENVKEEYLLRKIGVYKNLFSRTALAFRTEDFSDRNVLEEFAEGMLKKTGIKTLNLHDLNRLIELDKKSLSEDEKY